MKARVTITFDIDTDEYYDMIPSEGMVKLLAKSMINRKADFPENIDIEVSEI